MRHTTGVCIIYAVLVGILVRVSADPFAAQPVSKTPWDGARKFVSHLWKLFKEEVAREKIPDRIAAPLKNFAVNADQELGKRIDHDMEYDKLIADPTVKKYMYIPPSIFDVVSQTKKKRDQARLLFGWVDDVPETIKRKFPHVLPATDPVKED